MWLVNTKTLQLKQVSDETVHPFAILSHTWEPGEEVTFQEMQDLEAVKHKSGYHKIKKTCWIAQRQFQYVWIDTCCIDKTSSAELSEAINSMFRYYQTAVVCYVFLADFESLPHKQIPEKERLALVATRLKDCKWFTRGWTLQELIAPSRLEFYDNQWEFVGAKTDLVEPLFEMTKIDESVLRNSSRLYTIPVARRMSWASRRQTTRVEDLAYCLLGIFNITMPLLYGEGSKAFLRLQQQIALENSDLSIFAWEATGQNMEYSGVFAESPGDFGKCTTLKMHRAKFHSKVEITITNIGLRLSVDRTATHRNSVLLNLNCMRATSSGSIEWLGIYLRKLGQTYVRKRPFEVATTPVKSRWQTSRRDSTEPIYVQPWLYPDETERIIALERIVIIRYDEGMSKIIESDTGLPAAAYTKTGPTAKAPGTNTGSEQLQRIWENEQRLNPFGGAIFTTNAAEEFLGVQLIIIKPAPARTDPQQVLLFISLQWDGAKVKHNYALHRMTPELLLRYASIDTRDLTDEDYLERLQDYLLENCSDPAGLLRQEALSTEVNLYHGPGRPPRLSASIKIDDDRSLLPRAEGLYYLHLQAQLDTTSPSVPDDTISNSKSGREEWGEDRKPILTLHDPIDDGKESSDHNVESPSDDDYVFAGLSPSDENNLLISDRLITASPSIISKSSHSSIPEIHLEEVP